MTHHTASWVERTQAPQAYPPHETAGMDRHSKRQAFHHPHTSLGAAGHFVHMGAMLFPVLAAELITDAAKYKKAVRIGSVATTVLYEGLYALREQRRREEQEARLEACRSRD
jgi:hypothetical protein